VWLAAFFVSRLVYAFLSAHVDFRLDNVLVRVLVALKSLIFVKAMRRSIRSKTDDSNGGKKAPVADIANLLTADMDSVYLAGSQMQHIWMPPIQIGIVVYMLYRILDVAVFAGVGVIMLAMVLNFFLAKGYTSAFARIMVAKDERQKAVRELFSAIQVVKFNAWEKPFLARIQPIRERETSAIARWMYLLSLTVFLFWTSPVCVSVASFATYVLVLEEELTASKVFTALALFNLIRDPLMKLPESIQYLIQARIAFQRIRAFLKADEIDAAAVLPVHRTGGNGTDDDVVIRVENASFWWDFMDNMTDAVLEDHEKLKAKHGGGAPAVLADVNISIKKGDFVVVHGSVGSGKSSLCAALLGELPAASGNVSIYDRARDRRPSIAYYSQEPWIQNRSVRNNILFGQPFDASKYQQVIDACSLGPDLKQWPAGDQTEIGQRGVNLSGGQKARLALARACYADADIYVLDSPLAAVDAVVQSQIVSKCLRTLLRSKTIVLVTHSTDVIHSDAVSLSVLVENGTVRCERYQPTVEPQAHGAAEPVVDAHADNTTGSNADGVDNNSAGNEFALSNETSGTLVEKENRQKGRVKAQVFVDYFAALGGWFTGIAFLSVLVAWQGFQVGSDLWLSHWTGEIDSTFTQSDSKHNLNVYALLGLGVAVMVLVRTMLSAFVGLRAARHLFDGMTRSLVFAPLRFFDGNPIGRIINRFSEDMSVVDFRMAFSCSGVLVALAVTIAQLGTAAYAIRYTALVFLPLAFVYYKVAAFYLASSREISRLMKVAASPVLSHVMQSEDGVAVLRAFGSQYVDTAIDEHFELIDANSRAWTAKILASQWFALRVQLVGCAVVVLVVSTLVGLRNSLTPGMIGLAFMYAVNIDAELGNLVQVWSWFEVTMVSPERVMEYIGIPQEGSTEASKSLTLIGSPTSSPSSVLSSWPSHGAVVFEDVVFNYKPGAEPVLKGVSFSTFSNEKIGIVGRTGAGKSSLTMALFRINELVSGRILIDGVDIAALDLFTLRSRMSIIPQSPVLFQGTMRAYMDPFDEFVDADVWAALDKVGLKETVAALDGKLSHELRVNGENFSVGERQMLCMARALLRRSRLVVMDEATASIDHATERRLQQMIEREFADATVLTIAHRLATVLSCDRILVLGDGRVLEFDSPAALVRRPGGGVFYDLAREGGYLQQLLGEE
jgi:ATP-binding cassette subfamily C (CFTR/MRP) protein 1